MEKEKKKFKWHLIVFPLAAAIFCGWYLYQYYQEKGIAITVSFPDAKAIQSEKTRVFYRGVPIGIVKDIRISKKGDRAICDISLERTAKQFAVEDTTFNLVSPKVDFQGISGLDTLITGSYISIELGKSKKIKHNFKGNMSKQSIDLEENTSLYTIETSHAESISTGDNVFYRGIIVGTVGVVTLSKSAKTVLININIKNRYTKLIRLNTIFWKKQGIKADLGLFKSDIKINSLDTILKGGLELAIPKKPDVKARYGHIFKLTKEEPEDIGDWNPDLTFSKILVVPSKKNN